jgi:hypothetical protein
MVKTPKITDETHMKNYPSLELQETLIRTLLNTIKEHKEIKSQLSKISKDDNGTNKLKKL